jgi:DNA-binding transcriptional ArsR family regulator
MDKSAALRVFESLSSPARLDIFCQLVRSGMDGMVAGDLANALGVPASNLSFHLRIMREAGLVTTVPEGRFQRYHANVPHMLRMLAFVTENCCYKAEAAGKRPASARSPRRKSS